MGLVVIERHALRIVAAELVVRGAVAGLFHESPAALEPVLVWNAAAQRSTALRSDEPKPVSTVPARKRHLARYQSSRSIDVVRSGVVNFYTRLRSSPFSPRKPSKWYVTACSAATRCTSTSRPSSRSAISSQRCTASATPTLSPWHRRRATWHSSPEISPSLHGVRSWTLQRRASLSWATSILWLSASRSPRCSAIGHAPQKRARRFPFRCRRPRLALAVSLS